MYFSFSYFSVFPNLINSLSLFVIGKNTGVTPTMTPPPVKPSKLILLLLLLQLLLLPVGEKSISFGVDTAFEQICG